MAGLSPFGSMPTVINDAKKLRFLVSVFTGSGEPMGERSGYRLIYRIAAGFGGDLDQSDRQNLFAEQRRINQCLHQIMSWLSKLQISKKSHIVGMSIIGNLECRRGRNRDGRNPIRSKNANFRQVLSVATPVTQHGQFHNCDRQILDIDVLKYAHHAEFVANLETNIFAKYGIDQIDVRFAAHRVI